MSEGQHVDIRLKGVKVTVEKRLTPKTRKSRIILMDFIRKKLKEKE